MALRKIWLQSNCRSWNAHLNRLPSLSSTGWEHLHQHRHLPVDTYIHAPKSRPTNLGPSSDHEAPHNLAPTPRSYITEQSCLPRDPEGDTPIYVPKAGLLILVWRSWSSPNSVIVLCPKAILDWVPCQGTQWEKHTSVPPRTGPLALVHLQIKRQPWGQDPTLSAMSSQG